MEQHLPTYVYRLLWSIESHEKIENKAGTFSQHCHFWQLQGQGEKFWPSLRETQDKQPLGRDPKRSWCHCHTSVKLFWSQPMDCDQKGFPPMWQWHQPFSGSHPKAACPGFHIGCRLGQKLFTLLVYWYRCPLSHGLQSKRLYTNVVVTPVPIRVPILKQFVPSATSVVD